MRLAGDAKGNAWDENFETRLAPPYDVPPAHQKKGRCISARNMAKPVEVYQIKVTLRDSQPPIWRQIQVRSDTTLAKLHRILQRVMGWKDTHLHQFVIQDERYGAPYKNDEGSRKMRDERKHKLGDVLPAEGSEFRYEYDFGDDSQHVLVVEKLLPLQEGVRYPACLAGARACPPEDVGGISGYENFLQAIRDSQHRNMRNCWHGLGASSTPKSLM